MSNHIEEGIMPLANFLVPLIFRSQANFQGSRREKLMIWDLDGLDCNSPGLQNPMPVDSGQFGTRSETCTGWNQAAP